MLHTGSGRPYPEVRPASSAHEVRQHSDSSRLPLGLVQVRREESARDSEGREGRGTVAERHFYFYSIAYFDADSIVQCH